MQSADNTTPTPAPQSEKKPGFFARLFGKKSASAAAPVVPPHESHTPQPRLDDVPQTDAPVSPSVAPVADVVSAPVAPVATPEVTVPAAPVVEPVAEPVATEPVAVQPAVSAPAPAAAPTQTPPTTP